MFNAPISALLTHDYDRAVGCRVINRFGLFLFRSGGASYASASFASASNSPARSGRNDRPSLRTDKLVIFVAREEAYRSLDT